MLKPKPLRLNYIDALRGIAILGTIAAHTLGDISSKVHWIFAYLISNGNQGVSLFFIVSAFYTLLLPGLEGKRKKILA